MEALKVSHNQHQSSFHLVSVHIYYFDLLENFLTKFISSGVLMWVCGWSECDGCIYI